MRNAIFRILQALVLVAVASSFAHADNFMYLKKRAAGGGATNYCADASAQLCLFMDGNGGNETDRSSNGYTFVEAGGTIPTSATVPTGYSGTSRDFELSYSEALSCTEANCPNLDINGANAKLSIVLWINSESATNAIGQTIVNKWVAAAGGRQYTLELNGTGTNTYKITCRLSPDGAATVSNITTATDYASGTWHHVACVSNDTDIRIYIDGSLASTPTAHTSGIYDSASDIVIGGFLANGTSSPYDGLIDEVAIFNRELSSVEVSNIYTNGISGNKGGSD